MLTKIRLGSNECAHEHATCILLPLTLPDMTQHYFELTIALSREESNF